MGSDVPPVAYVLRYWPTLTETFVAREIDALQRSGQPIVVVALGHRADGALQDALPDVEVLRPPRGWALARVWGLHVRKRSARLAWLARALRARGVVRIHAHFAGEAAIWARDLSGVLGIPWSVTCHAVDLFKPVPGLPALLAEARPVVTVCAHHQRLLGSWGIDARVVRCGAPLDVPIADPSIQPPSVITVARDVPKKGLERLVAATRSLGVPLRIVGHAPRLAGPGVHVGALPPSAVPRALAGAQIFALPVRVAPDGDRDGVPVAMIEAMAAGLPVVTRPVSGVPELVDPSVGWIDVDLESALARAVADPSERTSRGRAARERAGSWATVDGSAAAMRAIWASFG